MTCLYVNNQQLGAIQVTKTRKHAAGGPGDQPHRGVTFTIEGQSAVTDANGIACVDGLAFGSHDVTETLPDGYVNDGPLTQSVTVDTNATCEDSPYAGNTATFSNTPLTNVTVSVDSQVPGGTDSEIDCGTAGSASTDTTGDGSLTINDLEPTAPTVTVTLHDHGRAVVHSDRKREGPVMPAPLVREPPTRP